MPDTRCFYKSSTFTKGDPPDAEGLFSDPDELEALRWKEIQTIQREVFESICAESTHQLERVFFLYHPSLILQVLATFTYPNQDGLFQHDPEVTKDAAELLGPSCLNLNALQSACLSGEEELAVAIIDYVAKQSEIMSTKKVLYEFMSKVWGAGNTALHLASFMGMANLVKRLIDLGANVNKRNERHYRAVDCADDDTTRALFLNLIQVVRHPIRRTMSVGGNLPRRREGLTLEPTFPKLPEKGLQRSKAAHAKRYDPKPRWGNHDDVGRKWLAAKEDLPHGFEGGLLAPSGLARTKSLGLSSGSENCDKLEGRASGSRAGRRVHFDAKTLALDYAKTGDFIELKCTLENEAFKPALLQDGEESVFDIATRHLRLTLLHLASSYNHLAICQYLVEKGAYVNPKDREGWTPIHCAAAEGHDAIVRFLLSVSNIVIHPLNFDDESPCDVAADDHIRGLLKEKLARRVSHDTNAGSGKGLDGPTGELQRGSKPPSIKGGGSGLLRPTRSLNNRAGAPHKPFSPPLGLSKPLDAVRSATPPSAILPTPAPEPPGFVLRKPYQLTFASF
ncbi:hypothetical protein L0F63_003312 [Massospora cicadina]|nr:hypothetical protein L0F63_003312 [Massospora cicadina]